MQQNKTILTTLIFCLMLSVCFAKNVRSVEPLSLKEFNYLCRDYSKHTQQSESLQCARYIKGFIDGAVAADSGVKQAQNPKKAASSFSDRAIKTRIGNRMKLSSNNDSSHFCLGDPISIANVIETVTKHIKENNRDLSARSAVIKILKDNYPCSLKK